MKKISKKILFKGHWLTLMETTCTHNDKEVKWESIERPQKGTIVVMVAKLIPSERYVLLKQFRPAVNNYVIGFPAGVSDGKDLEKNALKELKEETGYTGRITDSSPLLKLSPGIADDDVKVFYLEIDERSKDNIIPEQQLEPEEEIEVYLKKWDDIKPFIFQEKEKGTAISTGVWHIFCRPDKI